MSSKPGRVFPAFGEPPERQKAAGFERLPPSPGSTRRNLRLEPLAAAPIRAAVAVVAIPVQTTTPAAVVAVTVKAAVRAHAAHATVVAPAFPAAETVFHMG